MDAIEDIIKIYITGKWLSNIEHEFSFSEEVINNKISVIAKIHISIYGIICESSSDTIELANCENLKKLFTELKTMYIISEQQVVGFYLGIDEQKSDNKLKLQTISTQIFHASPIFQPPATLMSDQIYQVVLGDFRLEIRASKCEVVDIVYFFMINRIKRIFDNSELFMKSEASIINIKILSNEFSLNEKENIIYKESQENFNEKVNKPTSFPLQQSSVDNETIESKNSSLTDENECLKFLKSMGLVDSTALYLDEIITNAIFNRHKAEKQKRMKSMKKYQLEKELKSSVKMILSEMLNSSEINASEYEFLPKIIINKILKKKEKKVDIQKIREFIPIYLKSIRKKKKHHQ